MTRSYRFLAWLVPPPYADWIHAHEAELASIEGRWARIRWRSGLVRLTASALVGGLIRDPGAVLGSGLARATVATMSVVTVVAGSGLAVLFFTVPAVPGVVLGLSVVLIVQGGFTVAVLGRAFGAHHGLARRLQLLGSTAAVAAGATAFTIGAARMLRPEAHPEYGPMTMALLLAGHGLCSFLAFLERSRVGGSTGPR